MCFHAEFGHSALKNIGINRGENPKIRERWNSALLRWEAWLTPRYTQLLDECYRVKFGSSATKYVRINRREPKNWGALGTRLLEVGAWLA